MKTSLARILGALLLTSAIGSVASANPMNGSLTIAGGAQLAPTIGNIGTATGVSAWTTGVSYLTGETGTFSTITSPFPAVSFIAPWTFADPSTVLSDFLSLGGFTYALDTSWVVTQNSNGLTVDGMGWLTGNGFSATETDLVFTIPGSVVNQPASRFHTNSLTRFTPFTLTLTTVSVPDGGTTALMLGAALVGLTLVSRRRKALNA